MDGLVTGTRRFVCKKGSELSFQIFFACLQERTAKQTAKGKLRKHLKGILEKNIRKNETAQNEDGIEDGSEKTG